MSVFEAVSITVAGLAYMIGCAFMVDRMVSRSRWVRDVIDAAQPVAQPVVAATSDEVPAGERVLAADMDIVRNVPRGAVARRARHRRAARRIIEG